MDLKIIDPLKCDQFVSMFQHMKQFTDFTNITFQDDRMYLQCMDNAAVCIFEIILPASWFNEYNLKEGSVVIGINTGILYKVLSAKDKSQTIQLNTSDDHLSIHFVSTEDSSSKNVFDKHFEIPLLDVQTDLMEIPDMEHQAELTIPSNTFANLINQLKNFGDTMKVLCSEEKISLESFSIDLGKMSVEVSIDDLESFAIEEEKTMDLGFSLKYLHDIALYQKISKNIELGISDNVPLKATYVLDEGAYMNFYLAPKIDD